MKKTLHYLQVLAVVIAVGCNKKVATENAALINAGAQPASRTPLEISGEVFIVKKNDENVKLALVKVHLITKVQADAIEATRKQICDELKSLNRQMDTHSESLEILTAEMEVALREKKAMDSSKQRRITDTEAPRYLENKSRLLESMEKSKQLHLKVDVLVGQVAEQHKRWLEIGATVNGEKTATTDADGRFRLVVEVQGVWLAGS